MFPQVQLEVRLAIQNIMVHAENQLAAGGETSAGIYPTALPKHQANWTLHQLSSDCCRSWELAETRQP